MARGFFGVGVWCLAWALPPLLVGDGARAEQPPPTATTTPTATTAPAAADRLVIDVGAMCVVVMFSADNQSLVTLGSDNVLKIWSLADGAPRGQVAIGRPSIQGDWRLFELPDGKRLVAAGSLGQAYVIALADAKKLREFPVPVENYPHAYALVDGGAALLRLDRGRTFARYNLETGQARVDAEELPPPESPDFTAQTRLALAPDGRTYAVQNGGCSLRDAATHAARYVAKTDERSTRYFRNGHYHPLYSADGRLVVFQAIDGTARLVEVETGNELRAFHFTGRTARGVTGAALAPAALSPNGRWLLAGPEGEFGELTLFGAASGLELRKLRARFVAPAPGSVAFSSDGGWLAACDADFTKVHVWDVFRGEIRPRQPAPK